MKDHYNKLKEAHRRKLNDAKELEAAMRQTFELIYGFPQDVQLIVTQTFLSIIAEDGQSWGTPQLGDFARIASFDLETDRFWIHVGDIFYVTWVALEVVRGMIDE